MKWPIPQCRMLHHLVWFKMQMILYMVAIPASSSSWRYAIPPGLPFPYIFTSYWNLTSPLVRSVTREPLLHELSCLPEIPSGSELHCLPEISSILSEARIHEIPILSRSHAQGFGIATAREIPPGHIEPGGCGKAGWERGTGKYWREMRSTHLWDSGCGCHIQFRSTTMIDRSLLVGFAIVIVAWMESKLPYFLVSSPSNFDRRLHTI